MIPSFATLVLITVALIGGFAMGWGMRMWAERRRRTTMRRLRAEMERGW